MAAALIVLAAVWIGSAILYGTIGRLAEEVDRPAESGGVQLWADGLGLWRDARALGTGLASFGAASPRVRTLQAPVSHTYAESD